MLISFDLIELDGHDLRRERIEHRKARLAKLVRGPHPGTALHEQYEDDGEVVFQDACKLGWEGILSLPLSLGTLAALGEGQKSENGSRNRDNDRSLFRYDGSPLPAAADRLNQAARGGDIDKAVIAMRLVTAAQTGALSAAIMCSTMLRITIYATLIVILTMGAASAQNNLKDIQAGENSWRTEQEKKNDEAIDRSYQSTIKTLRDAEKKKSDPWADVRPAPPAAAKNKQ